MEPGIWIGSCAQRSKSSSVAGTKSAELSNLTVVHL
jgi:hypothetical protein